MSDPAGNAHDGGTADETAEVAVAMAFGDMDVEIGPIAYGTATLFRDTIDGAVDRLEAAVDCGMTLVDTADAWGFDRFGEAVGSGPDGTGPDPAWPGFGASEEMLARVFAELPDLRDRVVLSTKGGLFPPLPYDTSAEYLRQACDASLYRLGVDVIDLYQVHQPDHLTHPAEVAEVLTELRDAGKVREIGLVNHTRSQVETLQSFLDFPIVAVQLRFNPAMTGALSDGTLDLAMETGLTPLAWSPLAGGALCGETTTRKESAIAAVCDRIGAEQGVSREAVLLAWSMHHPSGIIPIVGASTVAHIRACARAEDVGLSRQQWYEILSAGRGSPLP
ncbi:MAG: aldo/keto reductase [Acidimicrobiales bacterium]